MKEWMPKPIEIEEPVVVQAEKEKQVEKDEQRVVKDDLLPKEDMDINMVCMLPMEFCAMDEVEVAQLSLGPRDAVFEKADESNRHMKSLYLNEVGRGDDELKKTNMTLNSFNGEPMEAKGIFSVELTRGNKTLPTAFFIVDVQDCFYLVLACFFDLLARIRLICIGKINNPRRGLHKGKRDGHAQPRLLHHQRDIATSSRIAYEGAQNIHHEEKSDMLEMSSPSLTKEEEKTDAPTLSEEGIKGKLNGADITQVFHCVLILSMMFTLLMMLRNVILNGLCDEHRIEKSRTVFREEGEDDVTMATTDTTIAHIMEEQDNIKIKSSKCWNPIRPPTTLLNSIGRRICIQPPFLTRIRLICIGKINNPRRGVSITKAQHNISYGCSQIVMFLPNRSYLQLTERSGQQQLRVHHKDRLRIHRSLLPDIALLRTRTGRTSVILRVVTTSYLLWDAEKTPEINYRDTASKQLITYLNVSYALKQSLYFSGL
uniref:Retrotransposon, putative, centromere-specific n=1 Tax=Oryza sativa subsp. japonica TaxID=39947 RepID=Q94GL0_ORYSJ|nr:hypothetical protein [Oryza sativa Japonica Group]AAO37833.1 hypothetical protein [Oryza sativa Japonica Group]